MSWSEIIVQLADEVISRLSVRAVARGEIETFDEMTIEMSLVLFD